MHIKQMQVVNVGPFENFSVALTRGSIGIFGANGSGKSTLVNLMYALITNDFGRFAGVKTDMVRNTADEKSLSFISGQVEHNGSVLEITRNLRTSRTKPSVTLNVDGTIITDTNKAQTLIYDKLGVSPQMLDLYVFKEQRRIYDFLTTTASGRAKAYQVLCRTEACEDLWNMLGTFLNKDKEVNTEIVDDTDDLTTAISSLQKELDSIESLLVEANGKLCVKPNVYAKYEEYLRKAAKREELLQDVEEATTQLNAFNSTLEFCRERERKASGDVSLLATRLAKRKEKLEEVQEILRNAKRKAAADAKWKKLEDELADLQEESKGSKPPKAPEDAAELERIMGDISRAEAALESATATVAAFADSGTSACPVCKTPVEHLTSHLEKAREQVANLPAEIKRLRAKASSIEKYRRAFSEYETWRINYEARLRTVRKELDNLEKFPEAAYSEEDAENWLTKYRRLETEHADATTALAKAETARMVAETNQKNAQRRLDELKIKLADATVPEEKCEKARRRLAEHAQAQREIARLEGEAKGLKKQIKDKEEAIKRVRSRLKRVKKLRQMSRVISSARDVLHRDRLPQRVAHANIHRIQEDMNEYLNFFGNPYWVEPNFNLSFVAHKQGEPPQAAERLSTGQQVVLAMAFWSSVASLWGSELGMLVLDEPTASLDADNRKLLRDALGSMTTRVRGNQQLIMVTHDPDLKNAFDQVITL